MGGTKVQPVHLTRQQRESRAPPAVQPGQLPDFGDSLVSAKTASKPSQTQQTPVAESTPPTLRDEALMSDLGRPGGSRPRAPVWAEPQDELDDQIYDWMKASDPDGVSPYDSVSVRGQVDEPMERKNHGATTTYGEKLLRKHAQRRSIQDGRSRLQYPM